MARMVSTFNLQYPCTTVDGTVINSVADLQAYFDNFRSRLLALCVQYGVYIDPVASADDDSGVRSWIEYDVSLKLSKGSANASFVDYDFTN
jgi:hypothetical protein